jgi:acyl carrier protein
MDAGGCDMLERLRDVLAERFGIDRGAIVDEARLYEDLDLDSIDAVDLIVRLRELTGRTVPPQAFRSVRTVGDVVRVLRSL